MSERTTHSKFAVAATILPLAIWVSLGLFFLLINWRPFFNFLNRMTGFDHMGLLEVIILTTFLFGVIPVAGHLTGAICGIIGLFSKNKKRIYAVIGLILNFLPLVAGIVIYFMYKSGYDFGIK